MSRLFSRLVVHVSVALLSFAVSLQATSANLNAAKQFERRLLGQSIDQPLAASFDSAVRQTLAELREKVRTDGKVRVIVGVRAAFAPEGHLSDGAARTQRRDIAAAQGRVHAMLPRQSSNKVTRFEFIPFMAMQVDADELEILAGASEVTDIQEDRPSKLMLAESVPVIHGNETWAAGYTGSGWAVAVLDSGVDKTHPFLSGAVVSEACYSSGPTSLCPGGVPQSTATGSGVNCPTIYPGCEHGTHVAGIAAGLETAGAAYSGVAKGAYVIAIQISSLNPDGVTIAPYTQDQLSALQRVYTLRASFNIAAVNMSLGEGQYYTQSTCDAANLPTKASIDNLRSVGIATIVSSGNKGYANSLMAPACISSAVSVGATFDAAGYSNNCLSWTGGPSSVDEVSCFSNSASFLDLLAPGDWITSSVPGGTYGGKQGTSQAAPHVAGCWAVLKQAAPTATVDRIEAALKNTGLPVQDFRNSSITKPRIDCKAALDSLLLVQDLSITAFNATPTAVNAGGTVSLSATVKNVGIANSGTTTLRYLYWTDLAWNDIGFCADTVGPLVANATSSQSCAIIPPQTPGNYDYAVLIDAAPGESNTMDNVSAIVTVTVTCATQPIAYGQTIAGSLTSGDCFPTGPYVADRYSFNGSAGDRIVITDNSATINTYLQLFAPNGAFLYGNDDAGGTTSARIPSSGYFTLPVGGTYLIEASAFGATEYGPYSLTLSRSPFATTTTLTSSANPSVRGQSVTLTATVTGTIPTGTVTFNDGATPLCSGVPLAGGQSQCLTSALGVGSHGITVIYSGDAINTGSTSVPLSQTVNKANTTTTIATHTSNPSTVGSAIVVTANVAVTAPGAGTPSGTITVGDGAANCVITLPATSCNLTPGTIGEKTLTAVYAGDGSFNGSAAPVVAHQVTAIGTNTVLDSSVNPGTVGQSVTFTATVTGGTPTGTVTFNDGVPALCSAIPLVGGQAQCQTAALAIGNHSITATYSGDATHAASTSSSLAQNIVPIQFALSVSISGSGTGTVSSTPASITCPGDCAEPFEAGTTVMLTAVPTGGSVFTGWLGGRCTGSSATCDVEIGGATTVTATFAPPATAISLDVDLSAPGSRYDALTDGLLIFRYLSGMSGQSLTNGVVGLTAMRPIVQIGDYIADIKPVLDVDGDGQVEAATDGLLIIRYLFGLRGSSLIAGAVGADATRTAAEEIEIFIQSILPL